MRARLLEESRDVPERVLSVRVYLQCMREAGVRGELEAGHDGAALAAIPDEPQQLRLVRPLREPLELASAFGSRAVVDEKAGQTRRAHGLDHPPDRALVVVDRDDRAREKAARHLCSRFRIG